MSNKVDAAQVTKAVAALRKHSEKVKAEGGSKLFDGDDDDDAETYSVMVSTRRVPQRASNKLVPIPLPHPLLSLDVAEVCLIVKDHQGEGHKDAKRKVAEMEKCGVAKVLGISKLRNNYKPHEAKRKLCDSYDLFLADARVLPLLPKLLGKTFFKKKRQPVPVDLTKKDWPSQVRKAAAATYARRVEESFSKKGFSVRPRTSLTSSFSTFSPAAGVRYISIASSIEALILARGVIEARARGGECERAGETRAVESTLVEPPRASDF